MVIIIYHGGGFWLFSVKCIANHQLVTSKLVSKLSLKTPKYLDIGEILVYHSYVHVCLCSPKYDAVFSGRRSPTFQKTPFSPYPDGRFSLKLRYTCTRKHGVFSQKTGNLNFKLY